LGGADPENVTRTVIDALAALEDAKVKVIIGGANPHRDSVKAACKGAGMDLIVDAPEMHALMTWADMAVSAGGTTCYELACMGVPMITIVLAENQRAVAEGIAREGAGIDVGWHAKVTTRAVEQAARTLSGQKKERTRMARTGEALVDGHGAARVCRTLLDEPLWLRPARTDDCATVFAWTNDPETRAASLSSAPVPWEEHVRWFESRLADPMHRFFIGSDAGDRPVGQVRFSRENDRATISVSLAPEARGKRLGTALIAAGCRRMFADSTLRTIDASIKPDNAASFAAFKKAGFREEGKTDVRGQPVLRCTLTKDTLQS
ncbi:MAG: GNAT family N-acetyltransferase, partial [Candidatus Peribacteraceae bacterium]|nr:GNAT family N-acetyltransferase [Candidatus Peribacteraceae bacterium]